MDLNKKNRSNGLMNPARERIKPFVLLNHLSPLDATKNYYLIDQM
jgi:hypothetical protein